MAKWERHQYGSGESLQVGRFRIGVNWNTIQKERPGYDVKFESVTLKKSFMNIEEAKQAGIQLARQCLIAALADLPSELSKE